MSQSRRQRRQLEKKFGLRENESNFLSKSEVNLRERRRKAGEEIHRQNLERIRNSQEAKTISDSSYTEESFELNNQNNFSLDRVEFKTFGPSGSSLY